jgi:hypothetical protein
MLLNAISRIATALNADIIRRHFMSREQFPTVLGLTDAVVREASLNTISSASRRGSGPTPDIVLIGTVSVLGSDLSFRKGDWSTRFGAYSTTRF